MSGTYDKVHASTQNISVSIQYQCIPFLVPSALYCIYLNARVFFDKYIYSHS